MGLSFRWLRGRTCRHRERSEAIQRFRRRGAIPACTTPAFQLRQLRPAWNSALAVIASATPHIGNEGGVTSRSTM